ncbi:hypothetical protein K9N68_20755 [Kovacikia minuta CCNUW1]|nr:hypothetical protein [Kovacikia minuta]UBF24144.1 hypothetical protein K9N68_20755 [Kovacikia minuta CCNUW1]
MRSAIVQTTQARTSLLAATFPPAQKGKWVAYWIKINGRLVCKWTTC